MENQNNEMQTPGSNSNTGLVIGVIASIVIMVSLVVMAIIVVAGQNTSVDVSKTKNSTDTEKPEGGQSYKEMQRDQRNTQREDDVARFLTAIWDYQTNNSGQTPFGDGTWDGKTVNRFIRFYIDENVEVDENYAEDTLAVCKPNRTCPQFSDPDGTMYGFTVDKAKRHYGPQEIDYGSDGQVDHRLHIYVNAICGSEEGTYEVHEGGHEIAIFYIKQGGSIICNDNY